MTVNASGFAAYNAQNVIVEVGKGTALGAIALEVGNRAETVTVEGTVPIIESTTDQLSVTFESKQVKTFRSGTLMIR